jgi:dihydrofolate synthase/folylpolyglutamate synthase
LEYVGHILLDGAHNVAGAKALAAYLDEFVDTPITMIFGAMKDKDIGEMAKILWQRADELILAEIVNSRAIKPNALRIFADSQAKVHIAESAAEALEIAGRVEGNVICVTGSLYLVGEIREILTRSGEKLYF